MNWQNVKLILHRETRDQLRDRRTLFMIAVLPLLLYPLLGTVFFQLAQFRGEHATKVWLIGADQLPQLPDTPRLLEAAASESKERAGGLTYFDAGLFAKPDDQKLLVVDVQAPPEQADVDLLAQRSLQIGQYDAVVKFPADFAARLSAFRKSLLEHRTSTDSSNAAPLAESLEQQVPPPEILIDTSREKSQLAHLRVADILRHWTESIGRQNLADSRVPAMAARPFDLSDRDVAASGHSNAAMWSKVLPFVLLIWALTGAFYPAVDLCAGEKERGTLETLLSSPAARSEIAAGKLLTIMLFSIATSVLNLLSMGITGMFVVTQLKPIMPNAPLSLPPWDAMFWLLLALIPMSAMFSALCLALAAFARSTKEGQYYLMPLLLVTMPLVMLPMMPGMELDLGNSLIPVTGVVLLLRMLLEGNYATALQYFLPVTLVTLFCCLIAMRWAIDQFNSESVLFRESERFDLGLLVRHMLRDREDTPNVGAAVLCGILILVLRFFISLKITEIPTDFSSVASQTLIIQLAAVLTPALLMAVMLTRKPLETLLIKRPQWITLPAVFGLALVLHPLVTELGKAVQTLYPFNDKTAAQLQEFQKLLYAAPNIWAMLAVVALLPAVVEELAFRGFILSGFRHLGSKWRAIALSSLLFGFTHLILQQSLLATAVGLVIGFIAVQTNSLLPGMVFHMVHNSLQLLLPLAKPGEWFNHSPLRWFATYQERVGWTYHAPLLLVSAAAAAAILWWFQKLSYPKTREEQISDALRHQVAAATSSS